MTQPLSPEFRVRSLAISVYLPSFLFAIGMGAATPVLPLLALDVGMSVPMAGAVVALRAMGTLIFDVPAGLLVAKFGEKGTMLFGTFLSFAAAIGVGMRPTPTLLTALAVLMGAAWSILLLARLTYTAEISPAHMRGRVMSALGGSNRLGILIGPLLGSAVIAMFGLTAAFYLQAVFSLAAFVALYIGSPPLQRTPTLPHHPSRGVRALFRRHSGIIAGVAVVSVVVQVLRSAREALIPLWGSHIGLAASQISLIFGLSALVEMAVFYPAGVVSDRLGRKWSTVPSLLVLSLGLALMLTTDSSFGMLLVGLLIGIGNGMSVGIQMTLGSDLSPPGQRAAFLGVWRLTVDGGNVLGPGILAVSAALVGLGLGALVVAAIGVAGAALMGFYVPDTRSLNFD